MTLRDAHADGECSDWCPICADEDARDASDQAADDWAALHGDCLRIGTEAAEERAKAEGRPKCRWCGQRRHMNVAPDWCGVCDEPATS